MEMSAKEEIVEFYEEWRTLSREEATAIQEDEWTRVHQCQSRKSALQKLIIQRTPVMEQELCNEDADAAQREIRTVIADLISMERNNGELIAERRRDMSAEKEGLETSSRKISRIKKAYASKPQTAWFSYS